MCIIHAEQESGFVGGLRSLLEQAYGLSVIVDEHSLVFGSHENMREEFAAAAVGGTIVITGHLYRCAPQKSGAHTIYLQQTAS